MPKKERLDSRKRQLAKNTFFIYLLRACNYVFPLITVPYLTRVLGENGYGVYTWANSVNTYFRMFVDFGFVIYGVQAVALCKGDNEKIGKVLYSVTMVKAIISALGLIVLVGLVLFNNKFNEHFLILLLFYSSTVLAIFNVDYIYQGIEKMQYITTRTILTKGIFTVLVFVFVHDKSDTILIPIFTFVGDLVVAFVMIRGLIFREKIKPVKPIIKELFEIIKKSNWFFLSRCFAAIYSTLNIIILGLISSASDVAQFSLAYSLICMCTNCINPIGDSIYPYMVGNKNIRLVKKLMIIFEPIIICGCIAAIFLSSPLITFVFGGEYTNAGTIFKIMLPIVCVALPVTIFGYPVLSAYGYYVEANLSIIIVGILHAIGLVVLYSTSNISIYSIAILTACSEVLVFVFRTTMVWRHGLLKEQV